MTRIRDENLLSLEVLWGPDRGARWLTKREVRATS